MWSFKWKRQWVKAGASHTWLAVSSPALLSSCSLRNDSGLSELAILKCQRQPWHVISRLRTSTLNSRKKQLMFGISYKCDFYDLIWKGESPDNFECFGSGYIMCTMWMKESLAVVSDRATQLLIWDKFWICDQYKSINRDKAHYSFK